MPLRVQPAPDADYVPLGPGIAVESPLVVTATDFEGYDAELLVVAEPSDEDRVGRLVCKSLTMTQRPDGPPITTEGIRRLPVNTWVKRAGAASWQTVEIGENQISFADERLSDEQIELLRLRGPSNPDTMRWLALAYRLALILGDPPTQAVQDSLKLTRGTAGRWIARARAEGYLSASEGQGKAGG